MTLAAVPIEIAAELSQECLNYITELVEDNYVLDDILKFLKVYNGDDFISYYVDYEDKVCRVGYEIVDAFLELNNICDIDRAGDAYVGEYESKADFAENYYNGIMDVPDALVIDWEETFNRSLSDSYDYVEDGTYDKGYIFQRHF